MFYFLLLLLLTETTQAADLNVGTTLFTKADGFKECWSSESLALLTSRMILEDLLPSTSILVIDSDEFVTDLVEYFRMILEIVRQETHGKTKHITLLALTDLLGGYLHHAVLPIAKYAYYAGLIDYDSITTLLGLFDELKWFLRTNGQGWSKPLTQSLENFEIQRIPLQPPYDKELCQNLILVESDRSNGESAHCDAIVPMPFFDSIIQPSAIAFPTKSCPLHNVEANTSSYLVMKFFITAYKCLQYKNVKNENMEKFQTDFCAWIEEQVMPRLDDEKFYAAFGGVLRVRNTLKRLGVTQNHFEKQIEENHNNGDEELQTLAPDNHEMSRSSMILMAVLITIFVWFLLGTMFICYKMRQTKQQDNPSDSEEGGKTTTCTSLVSSKYFYPEKPKCFTSSSKDSLEYHKKNWSRAEGTRQEITIKTCHCHDDDEDEEGSITPGSGKQGESSHTEGRLPSITEISEQSTSTPKQRKSPGGSSAAASNDPRRSKVQKQVYMESESETEETSEPA